MWELQTVDKMAPMQTDMLPLLKNFSFGVFCRGSISLHRGLNLLIQLLSFGILWAGFTHSIANNNLIHSTWSIVHPWEHQLRQSFKPGEVTPEEANKIGCELADRFLKHNHAYIVSTHLNAHCVHNHISFSAVTLDCKHKFRNFLGSGKALGRLSDQICLEHKLSVVSDPRMHDTNYDHWLGDNIKLTNRDQLRSIIDEMLLRKPDGFDALMRLLADAGW